MTANEPQIDPNGRYSIKQTCAILDCHRNSLLNWTNEGRIRCNFNTRHKFYLGRDILKFWREIL